MIDRQLRRNSLLAHAIREHHEVMPAFPHRVDFKKREVDGIPVSEIARWIAGSKWNNFNDRPKDCRYFEVEAIATEKLEDDFMRCLDWLSRTGVPLGRSNNWAPLRAEIGSLLGKDGCDYLDDKAYHRFATRRWRRRKKEEARTLAQSY